MTRVFSGIQPSGELHIGNYLGAVQNWVQLQHQHDCLFCIVDLHAITQPYDIATLPQRTIDMAVGLFASGLDPEQCIVFVQSHVPEHSELNWLLMVVTPLGELERQTQFKEKSQRQESIAAGLLNYPVLQSADVLLYKGRLVPVGEDQVQHLELMREIARRWNARFGEGYFPEPQPLLTKSKRVLGLDGQAKMSKSLGNTIGLFDSPETIWEKLRPAATDPARKTRKDSGNPDICNIFTIHQGFSPPATLVEVAQKCRTAGWGCLDCKRVLADNMIAALTPIRERADALKRDPRGLMDRLRAGAAKASALARVTIAEVRERMGFLKLGQGAP
ncbi:MAG TPA: tryptophan--tRNA ligase [Gemmatimonadales bacterium]|nr:tryptophan--tRNA ligase [Gemmatimonadales bacterium]